MREFRLRIRDYAKFVAQHPRIKNLSDEQREKLIEFVAGRGYDVEARSHEPRECGTLKIGPLTTR